MVSHVCHFFPVRVCVLHAGFGVLLFHGQRRRHNWQGSDDRCSFEWERASNLHGVGEEPLDVAISRCRDGFVIRGFGETHRA